MYDNQFQRSAIDAGGAMSSAWEMVKFKYGMYLGVAILTMVLTGCIPCVNIFIMGPLMGGIAFLVLRDMRGEPVEFGMMFKGFEKFVPLMVIGLIQAIPGIVMQIIQYGFRFAELGLNNGRGGRPDFDFFAQSDPMPWLAGGMLMVVVIVGIVFFFFGIIWWACFFFAIPLAMEYDLSPIDAIKLSARAAMSNLGGLVILLILTCLLVIVGVLMLCVGAFLISMPIIYVANVIVYRQVFPYFEQNMRNMTPPPPNEYGFGAGMPAA